MAPVIFYPGLHQPADARHFQRACISINRLLTRVKPVDCGDVLLDSGAFTELSLHGQYRSTVQTYAERIRRLHGIVRIKAAVAQDFMCEPFMLQKTGLTVERHQALTIERYDELLAAGAGVPIMPVLQGFDLRDYVRHVEAYGDRLQEGAWVGVGSVCKRNSSPVDIANVLAVIKSRRPDLRLHGFGVKKTALTANCVRELLYSADSMAWSYHARINGRSGNDWREAKAFEQSVLSVSTPTGAGWQMPLPFGEPL